MSQSFFFVFELPSLLKVAKRFYAHFVFVIVSKCPECFEDQALGKMLSFVTS